VSGSIDVNGPIEMKFGRLEVNGTLYASRVNDPVAVRNFLTTTASGALEMQLVNAPSPARTWGAEALARWIHGDARLTATYAYLRATEWNPDASGDVRRDVPLAPRHTAGVVGSLEREGVSRIGIELYYTGRQALENNPYRSISRPYVIVGFLGERIIATPVGRARLFINAENVGNVRQTRFDPLVRPSRGPGGRWTTDAWTELSRATVNGGVRLSF
jgi:iron complex outermembrane receptor protein